MPLSRAQALILHLGEHGSNSPANDKNIPNLQSLVSYDPGGNGEGGPDMGARHHIENISLVWFSILHSSEILPELQWGYVPINPM